VSIHLGGCFVSILTCSATSAVKTGVKELLNQVYKPFTEALEQDFETGFRKLVEVDKYSTREYLRSHLFVTHLILQKR
jgi:hypothetical protein